MPSIYQVVPYLVLVRVPGHPTELKPIWDIDAKETSLADLVCRIFATARGLSFTNPDDESRQLEIGRVHAGPRSVLVEFKPGRSGIESVIRKPNAEELRRQAEDTEFVPVRHLFYFPSGGHQAILLAERVGHAGAVTMSSRLLRDTFKVEQPTLSLAIEPAVTSDILRAMIEDEPVKSLVFTRPGRPEDDRNVLLSSGKAVTIEVSIKPPRREFFMVDQLPKEPGTGKLTSASLLGLLAPIVRPGVDAATVADSLNEDGWISSLEVEFKGGTKRRVNMQTARSATMSFPMTGVKAGRPDDSQFLSECEEVLRVLNIGPAPESGDALSWSEAEWQTPKGKELKGVMWDGKLQVSPDRR